ncbi:protein kinase [Streptomyces sp. NBC_01242]|uniref:protein kinase domain-containing protein n=1 Tax=unclassified Streptomyces TaxID=2593676 RepID=UPI00225154B7|nr:protein kinase [Streptomyces sp. NBC_01242]MCX4794315.1 protein kinase [Streptomyces sp. NBC_01242]WSU21214.1 protein kinase [Streptomyces sp. NBC_01108]
MKQGDEIAGYRVVSEPTNANGGKCMWAFAEKDGHQYFLKRFLEPKRPREGSTASAASRRIRLEVCQEFEDRHRGIMKRLRPDARGGGNLVLATDFFHEGSTYYKVTERIDTSSLEKPQALEPRQKAVLLKTLALSLQLLHDIDVVHGDLKPLNVLVQKREGVTFYSAKLIDFDDSYVSGRPPGRQEVAGDSLYGAPEWRRYVQEDESVQPEHLTTAVDVFALGLMTHYYLTGALPGYSDRYGSPADAVNAGESLVLDPRLTDSMQGLVRAMTAPAPRNRPRMATYLKALKDPQVCALVHRRPGTAKPASTEPPAPEAGGAGPGVPGGTATRTSRVRANLGRGKVPAPTTRPASSPPPPSPAAEAKDETPTPTAGRTSRVRINLGDRRRTS